MEKQTKQEILKYVEELTEDFENADKKWFTAGIISQKMNISRSLTSQYLNELVKEGQIFKINTRLVYFLHKRVIEAMYHTSIDEEFYDFYDFKNYIFQSNTNTELTRYIGYDKSLADIVKQFEESFAYPPTGIPMVIYGEVGTGKKFLCDTIFKVALKKRQINAKSKLIKIDFNKADAAKQFHAILKYYEEGQNTVDNVEYPVLVFCNAQNMTTEFQDRLCMLIENSNLSFHYNRKNSLETRTRIIILSDKEPELFLNERLVRNIPVKLKIPALDERFIQEKEELIIYILRCEEKTLHKRIKISNSLMRVLVEAKYKNNIIDLKSTIRKMCAAAMFDNRTQDELILHAYDLPKDIVQSFPIMEDGDTVYIEVDKYVKSEEVDIILDYLENILKPFESMSTKDLNIRLDESKAQLNRLMDYLIYKQKYSTDFIKKIEFSLKNIFNRVFEKQFINLPVSFSYITARLIDIFHQYDLSVTEWSKKNKTLLDSVICAMKKQLMGESRSVEYMQKLIMKNLEINIPDVITIIMYIVFHYYNRQLSEKKTIGLIACHGYSTASSIADAVNTMLNSYVFEAIDMPLNIPFEQIKDAITAYLNRMKITADVIIMVDTGSLEQLGDILDLVGDRNIGVINNVSTKTALDMGEQMLKGVDMRTSLRKVCEDSKAVYTIVEKRKKEVIVFLSDSGIHMAKRMLELFTMSMPREIPVDYIVRDYNELLSSGRDDQLFRTENVLFITGTANPNIAGYVYISLEEIILSKNLGVLKERLAKYLQPEELSQMVINLRKNFTLQNVVRYLTILNPNLLLDHVMEALEILQSKLNIAFGGKSLIGICIHVCCLIERLVTKNNSVPYKNFPEFQVKHGDFIRYVNESFVYISEHYNIQIPLNEIAYLYEFIESDDGQFEDYDLINRWNEESDV